MPKIFLGEPPADEQLRYKFVEKDTIKIYFSSRLKIKDGYKGIKIKLRKLLFFKWLELEGGGE